MSDISSSSDSEITESESESSSPEPERSSKSETEVESDIESDEKKNSSSEENVDEERDSDSSEFLDDLPENIEDHRPPANVYVGCRGRPKPEEVEALKTMQPIIAERKKEVKAFRQVEKETSKEEAAIEEEENEIVAFFTSILTLSNQQRFFYELVKSRSLTLPEKLNYDFLQKIPEWEDENREDVVDSIIETVKEERKILQKSKAAKFKKLFRFIKKVLPTLFGEILKIVEKYPEKFEELIDMKELAESNSELDLPQAIQEFKSMLEEDSKNYQQIMQNLDEEDSLSEDMQVDLSKTSDLSQIVKEFQLMLEKFDGKLENLFDPEKFTSYLESKLGKEKDMFLEVEDWDDYPDIQDAKAERKNAKRKRQAYEDKQEELEKKTFRLNSLIQRYEKEQTSFGQEIDESGNEIVRVPQDLLDRMKEDVAGMEKQIKELEEEMKKIKEKGKNLSQQRKTLEEELHDQEITMENTPEIVAMDSEIAQTACDIKFLKKEYHRIGESEQHQREISDDFSKHVNFEESEFNLRWEQILEELDNDLEEIVAEKEKVEEEMSVLPKKPDTIPVFMELVNKAESTLEDLKNGDFIEVNEKLDEDIEEGEEKLDECTNEFDQHIRIEYDEKLLENIKKGYTDVDDDTISFLMKQARSQAEQHLKTLLMLPEDEVEKELEEIVNENEKLFLEVTKMNETIQFLNEATDDEKRRFYTKEAERRVRYTRHRVDRTKEVESLTEKMVKVNTATEEKLGNFYDQLSEWCENVEKQTSSQKDSGAVLFESFSQMAPEIRDSIQERQKTLAETDKLMAEYKELQKEILDEFENDEADEDEVTEEKLDELQFETVQIQLEIDQFAAEGDELDALIKQEEERLKELQQKSAKRASSHRKLQRKLKGTENMLIEAKNKQEEKKKIAEYGSFEKMIEAETARLKELTKCTNCKVNEKSAIITKCFHVFCMDCIQKMINTRNRKCPKCKIGFGTQDFHSIYLGSG